MSHTIEKLGRLPGRTRTEPITRGFSVPGLAFLTLRSSLQRAAESSQRQEWAKEAWVYLLRAVTERPLQKSNTAVYSGTILALH